MTRVVLVKPPERSRFNFGGFSLAVLAAAVTDIADVSIVDATDMPVEEAARAALGPGPDVVGVTTMGLASVMPAAAFARALRDGGFRGLLVAGGHGATMTPRYLLENGVDAVACGEGEMTFRELLQRGVSAEVCGLALLRDGEVHRTPPRPLIGDLDELREPARSLTGPPPDGVFTLETSRGCPHGCTFCETTRFFGRRWRARSPEAVARDVARLVEDEGAVVVQVADDNFTADPARAIRISRLIRDGPLPLMFLFFARSDDVLRSEALAPALAEAHFLRASIGIETVSDDLTTSIKKNISYEQHRRAIARLKAAGIFTVASLIVGLPGETEAMRASYVEDVVALGVDTAFFLPFQPFPGTPLARGNGEPEPWCVEAAARLTAEFERHPEVIARLEEAGKEPTVRGLIARSSLARRQK